MSYFQEIVVVSGRSGAGKTTAARALEDMGYFVVDNLPPQLLDDLLSLADKSKERIEKIAVIIDVRETGFLELMPKKWQELSENKYIKKLLFLDASDQQLIDRYQETKRRHPLDDGCGIRNALAKEQEMLEPIKNIATKEIFTDKLNGHELRNVIKKEMMSAQEQSLHVTIMSFGFKYGVPSELDLCFDVRFLTNPFYQKDLRSKSGLDDEVYNYVLSLPSAHQFLDKVIELIEFLYPLYKEEGKSSLTIAIGCTGGQHRSISLVKAVYLRLQNKWEKIRIEHRDLHRSESGF
jgi:UPF0042 nucleotide-binding protein